MIKGEKQFCCSPKLPAGAAIPTLPKPAKVDTEPGWLGGAALGARAAPTVLGATLEEDWAQEGEVVVDLLRL